MVAPKQKKIRSEEIYDTLLDRIITGEYPEGYRLKEEALGEEFNISRTPVREILRQLAADGLVKVSRDKGAAVLGFTEADIEEIYDIRKALEVLAINCSIMNLSLQKLSGFRKRLQAACESENIVEHTTIDIDLHEYLIESTGRRRLIDLLKRQYQIMKGFRHLGYVDKKVIARASRQHLALIDCLMTRDADGSISVMQQHIEDSKRTIISVMIQRNNMAK